MPAVFAAISTVFTAFKASAIGTFLTTTTGRLLASVAIAALQQALAPKPKSPGIETDFTSAGGTNPCSFVLGRYATAGNAVSPPMSHGDGEGTPNGYLTYVIDLGDVICGPIARVLIDGRYGTIGDTPHELYGLPILDDFLDYAWLQFHDGSQTTADATLMAIYTEYPERPWTADMVGRNVPHAILTFRYNTEIYGGPPEVRCEVDGIPVYDPRLDSSVGGSGAQRWSDPTTWVLSTNPMVLIYNILRGITLPDLGVWGGQFEAEDLPLGAWFTAMNECDVAVELEEGGSEPAFRAGLEVKVNQTPAEVIEALLAACNGQLADIGGIWKPRVGGPGLPVFFFDDDDIVVSRAQEFRPFPSLDDRHNAISASYPEPETGWDPKDAPPIYNATWEAEDGGRRLERTLSLSAVPYANQVQRLMRASIAESRRFYEHSLVLPPDAAILEPLDAVSWTSARHQYTSKSFEVGEVSDDQQRLLQAVALRERDGEDHIWIPGYQRPFTIPSQAIVRPPLQRVPGWTATGVTLFDGAGAPRKPAIALSWQGQDQTDVSGLQWEVRLADTENAVLRGSIQDVSPGRVVISDGIIPGQAYEARGQFVVARPTDWSNWLPVTAPDVRVGPSDLGAGAVQPFNFALGIEPVTIILDASLPTEKSTEAIYFDGKLYRWDDGAYVATVPTDDLLGQITSTQITDEAITTPKIATNAITASKMTLVPGQLVSNFNFATGDLADWTPYQLAPAYTVYPSASVPAACPSTHACEIFSTGGATFGIFTGAPAFDQPDAAATVIPLTPGRRYRATVSLGFFDTTPVYSGNLFAAVLYADGSRGLTGVVAINQVFSPGWTVLAGEFTAPTGAVGCWLYVYGIKDGGSVFFTNVTLSEMASAELIVDGAIIAGKLAANAVTAGTVAAGAISADSIAVVSFAAAGLGVFGGGLQSEDFVPGVSGWEIDNDGHAEFNDITLRGDLIAGGSLMSAGFGAQGADFLLTGTSTLWQTLAQVSLPVKAGKPVHLDAVLTWRIESAGGNAQEVMIYESNVGLNLQMLFDIQQGSTTYFTRLASLFSHIPTVTGIYTYNILVRKGDAGDRDLLFRGGVIRAFGIFN